MSTARFNFTKIFITLAIGALLFGFFGTIFQSAFAAQGINEQINFQGKLVDANGLNVANGTYDLVFKITNDSAAADGAIGACTGACLWRESQTGITVTDGIFRVALGSANAFGSSVDWNSDTLYLALYVNNSGQTSEVEMTPRIRLASVPQAFNAKKFNGLSSANNSASWTVTGGTSTASTLTVNGSLTLGSTIQPTAAGGLTVDTNGSNTLSLGPSASGISLGGASVVTTALGGLTVTTAKTFTVNGDAFTDLTGNGLAVSSNALTVSVTAGSGMSVGAGGLTLLTSCSDQGLLKWTAGSSSWGCGSDNTSAGGGGNNWWQLPGSGVLAPGNVTTDVLFGGISSSSAVMKISSVGTSPVASISARSSYAALVADNTIGDLFTASSSGLTRFVITQQGAVGIGTKTPLAQLMDLAAIATPTNDLMDIGNATGQEPTGDGLNALQVTWKVKPGAGNTTAAQRINITNSNTGSGGRAPGLRILATGPGGAINSATEGITIDGLANASNGTTAQNALEIGANWDSSIFGTGDLRLNANGNIILATASAMNTKIGIGTAAPLAGVDIRGIGPSFGTTAIASVSGITSYAGLTVDNSGVGDIFTASTAGMTRFVIRQNGSVGIGTSTPQDKLSVSGGNIRIDAQTNSVTALTAKSQAAGQVTSLGAPTTSIASVSATAVYNGSLYAGTTKTGAAEVYRYNNSTGNWTVVNTTAGTFNTTSSINGVSAMTVFNGYLYIGTDSGAGGNKAEVYRYNGGTGAAVFTAVSQPVAGTIRSGGTATIDAVASMVVYNGKLFIGTREPQKAEIYRYEGSASWTLITNTAGKLTTTGNNTGTIDSVQSMAVYNNSLYVGTKKAFNGEIYRYIGSTGTANFTNASGAAGTICGSARANSEVSTLVVYNGNLYAGTYGEVGATANVADVCRYEFNPGGTSTTWTRIINAAGQIITGGTANIDGIRSMAVYNGRLYIGTQEPANAQIYQYIDGIDWILLNTTPGTLQSTSSIDQVTSLIQWNSTMFAGTGKAAAAEVYSYSNITDESYALKFHASSLITGESNNLTNDAAIWFMASPSANLNTGINNTGSFMFSHGLITGAGAYDVAEDYPTRDDSLEPGDVIAIDENESGMAKKSSSAYETTVIGVYSENPALHLSQSDPLINGAKTVPVALAGRVSVKVSAENGVIKKGDLLTSASTPGVAMKATKAGSVLGKALEDFSDAGVGKISAFVYAGNSQGQSTSELYRAMGGPDVPFTSALSTALLGALTANASNSDQTQGISEITTDRVAAGLEIITPRVVSDTLLVNTIAPATNKNVSVVLGNDGAMTIGTASNSSAIVFDSNGNGFFSGTLTAEKIKANHIEGLDLMVSHLLDTPVASSAGDITQPLSRVPVPSDGLTLTTLSVDGLARLDSVEARQATVSGNFRVKGDSLFEGMLHVIDTITTHDIIISGLAHFFGDVVFKGTVLFEGQPTFNNDTAGFALIHKGDDRVTVSFTKEYEVKPVVSATISVDQLQKPDGSIDPEANTRLETRLISNGYSFVVIERTTKGFTILLNKKAEDDISMSWVALAVKNGNVFESKMVPQSPTLTPSVVPPLSSSEPQNASSGGEVSR